MVTNILIIQWVTLTFLLAGWCKGDAEGGDSRRNGFSPAF